MTQNSIISPHLSIIMPVFNHKEMVATMIDSILANDYQDWELLAVDDGSTQDTLDLLKHYEGDSRIHIIQRNRAPKGAQTCRNIGLEMAQGEYVVFFDSDDYITPTCLKSRVEALERYPELDFMVFRSGIFCDGTFRPEPTNLTFGYPVNRDDIEAFCTRFLPFVVWNNIYRRQSLVDNHITWDTKLLSLQDSMFNLQCLLAGLKYSYSDTQPDYGYRLSTPGSVSKKLKSKEHLESHVYITKRFFSEVQRFYGDFNLTMAAAVRRYSLAWGCIFYIQVRLFHLLCHFLPLSLARQLSFLCYLLWASSKEKRKPALQRRVKNKVDE